MCRICLCYGAFEESTKMQVELTAPIQKIEFWDVSVFLSRLSKASIKEREFNADNGELIYDYWGKWQRKKHTD